MEKNPLVFVVILNWNGKDRLDRALRSVFHMEYDNFQTVVVDNDSTDGSFESARKSFGRAHFIRNESNVGFSRGMNVGIRYAIAQGADYVWLLNNDAEVDRLALQELVSEAKRRNDRCLLSPIILTSFGRPWFSGGKILWWRMRVIHTTETRSDDAAYGSDFLTGCALFFSKKTIVELGLLDEGYFLYYEDADLSFRAKKRGMELLVVPKAIVLHSEESRMNPDKTYWLVYSGLRFFHTHSPILLRPWMFCFTLLRRMKNAMDARNGAKEALMVRRAYRDYGKNASI